MEEKINKFIQDDTQQKLKLDPMDKVLRSIMQVSCSVFLQALV